MITSKEIEAIIEAGGTATWEVRAGTYDETVYREEFDFKKYKDAMKLFMFLITNSEFDFYQFYLDVKENKRGKKKKSVDGFTFESCLIEKKYDNIHDFISDFCYPEFDTEEHFYDYKKDIIEYLKKHEKEVLDRRWIK